MGENVTIALSNVTEAMENVTVSVVENITSFTENVTATVEVLTGESLLDKNRRMIASWQYRYASRVAFVLYRAAYTLGIPGNLLTLVVLLRLRPFTTSSFLFSGMAVCDLLYLVMVIGYTTNPMNLEVRRVTCVSGAFSYWTSSYMSVSFGILLAIERAVAVWKPLLVSSLITMKRCVVAAVAMMVLSFGLHLHFLFVNYFVYSPEIQRWTCLYRSEMDYFATEVMWEMSTFVDTLIPAAFFFLSIIIILVGLKKSQQLQRQMTSDDAQLKEKAKRTRQVAVMLVSALCVFLVTCLPYGVLLFSRNVGLTFNYASSHHLWVIFLSSIFYALRSLNHAVNCYCYFFTARRFRAGVFDVLTLGGRLEVKLWKGKKEKSSGVTSVSTLYNSSASRDTA